MIGIRQVIQISNRTTWICMQPALFHRDVLPHQSGVRLGKTGVQNQCGKEEKESGFHDGKIGNSDNTRHPVLEEGDKFGKSDAIQLVDTGGVMQMW